MTVRVEVSFGELIDKITILRIKRDKFDGQKRTNVERELATLENSWSQAVSETESVRTLVAELQAVNLRLWDIEDAIRVKEAGRDFDDDFIALARSVYVTNDERARLKRELNTLLGSELFEEKQYVEYDVD